MAIVAKKKRGGAIARGGARASGWRTHALPLAGAAVLVALAALLAWRWAAARSESAPHQAEEPPAPPVERAAGRSESAPHPAAAVPAAESMATRPEVAPYHEGEAPAPQESQQEDGWPPYPLPDGYVVRAGQMALPNGKVMTFPPPTEDKPRMLVAGGKTWECLADGRWRDVTPRLLFGTAFEENFLALSVEGRSFIPAFLTGLDQDDVVNALRREYVPKGDETEDELAQLAAYDEMRSAALAYVEEGGSFDDFVTEIASFEQAQRRIQASSMRQVMGLFREGRVEEAKARAAELDAIMAEQGYRPLRLPAHVRAAFGEE